MDNFTLTVLTTRHGRPVVCGPYAWEESARADLLDWVYGLGAFCGWVTDHAGRVVAAAGGRCGGIATGHDDAEAA